MADTPKRHPRKKAVALRYEMEQDAAPRVLAKGQGVRAERILDIARAHGVYIEEDADLVEVLSKLEVGMAIPEELYQAVAHVLALVYRLNQRFDPAGRPSARG